MGQRTTTVNEHLAPGFGKRIRNLRIEQDLAQRDLGAKSGVSYAYISRIESEERLPSLSALIRIAEALNVTPLYLASGDEHYCVFCQR